MVNIYNLGVGIVLAFFGVFAACAICLIAYGIYLAFSTSLHDGLAMIFIGVIIALGLFAAIYELEDPDEDFGHP